MLMTHKHVLIKPNGHITVIALVNYQKGTSDNYLPHQTLMEL